MFFSSLLQNDCYLLIIIIISSIIIISISFSIIYIYVNLGTETQLHLVRVFSESDSREDASDLGLITPRIRGWHCFL